MFSPIEVWGVIDVETQRWWCGYGTIFWTLDKEEAKDFARRYNMCEYDAVKPIPDIIVAAIPGAAGALKNILEIRRLRNLVRASEHEMVKGWGKNER